MKVSIQATIFMGAIFAVACLGVAAYVFASLATIADPVQHADAVGFGWFWMFLGSVGVALCALAWWLGRRYPDGMEDA